MERLTEKAYGIAQIIKNKINYKEKPCYKTCENICISMNHTCDKNCPIQNVISKLFDYENTNLIPDEIPHWISVSEKMPDENIPAKDNYNRENLATFNPDAEKSSELVIVEVIDENGKKFTNTDITVDGKWANFPEPTYKITRWMKIPK